MKLNFKKLTALLCALVMVTGLLMLCACKPGDDPGHGSTDPVYYKVTFDGSGGTFVSGNLTQNVEKGKAATAPVFVLTGYKLSWDKAFNNIAADTTVKAIWTPEKVESRVDILWWDYSYMFSAALRADSSFAELLGGFSRIVNHDAQSSQSRLTSQVNTAITAGTDLLIVNIAYIMDTSYEQIVSAAKNADIPIVFFSEFSEVPDGIVKSYDKCTFIGVKPEDAGIMQGTLIANFLLRPENINDGDTSKYAGSDGKSIKYAILRGDLDNIHSQYRTLYSIRTAQKIITDTGKDWVLINAGADCTGNIGWTTTDDFLLNIKDASGAALSVADQAIMSPCIYGGKDWAGKAAYEFAAAFPNADSVTKDKLGIIVGNNDIMALGVIKYLQNSLYLNTSAANTIPVFGIDATLEAVNAISEGSMAGSILLPVANYVKILAKFAYLAIGDTINADKITADFTKINGVEKILAPYIIVDNA